MSNRYDEIMISSLDKYINEKAKELGVEYMITFDMKRNQYRCKIKNCDMAGDFSIYIERAIKNSGQKSSIRFEFPNILKEI